MGTALNVTTNIYTPEILKGSQNHPNALYDIDIQSEALHKSA